jgi:hypothetical protein
MLSILVALICSVGSIALFRYIRISIYNKEVSEAIKRASAISEKEWTLISPLVITIDGHIVLTLRDWEGSLVSVYFPKGHPCRKELLKLVEGKVITFQHLDLTFNTEYNKFTGTYLYIEADGWFNTETEISCIA